MQPTDDARERGWPIANDNSNFKNRVAVVLRASARSLAWVDTGAPFPPPPWPMPADVAPSLPFSLELSRE